MPSFHDECHLTSSTDSVGKKEQLGKEYFAQILPALEWAEQNNAWPVKRWVPRDVYEILAHFVRKTFNFKFKIFHDKQTKDDESMKILTEMVITPKVSLLCQSES